MMLARVVVIPLSPLAAFAGAQDNSKAAARVRNMRAVIVWMPIRHRYRSGIAALLKNVVNGF